jgi:sigma-B regulation protein RsbU (phosphoserine phosphatase)
MVLGALEDAAYEGGRCTLGKGDMLFLYTDGVTEAENRSKALYGEERLLAHLDAGATDDAAAVVAGEKADIEKFTAGVPASDDITMLVLRRNAGAGENGSGAGAGDSGTGAAC